MRCPLSRKARPLGPGAARAPRRASSGGFSRNRHFLSRAFERRDRSNSDGKAAFGLRGCRFSTVFFTRRDRAWQGSDLVLSRGRRRDDETWDPAFLRGRARAGDHSDCACRHCITLSRRRHPRWATPCECSNSGPMVGSCCLGWRWPGGRAAPFWRSFGRGSRTMAGHHSHDHHHVTGMNMGMTMVTTTLRHHGPEPRN